MLLCNVSDLNPFNLFRNGRGFFQCFAAPVINQVEFIWVIAIGFYFVLIIISIGSEICDLFTSLAIEHNRSVSQSLVSAIPYTAEYA